MNDYRLTYPSTEEQQADRDGRAASPFLEWLRNDRPRGFVTSPMPPDRTGLLAALHDRCCVTDAQVEAFHTLAESIAKETQRRIYVVFTTGRWHLILLSIETEEGDGLWYDGHEVRNGKSIYAADQFIGHYEPDGSFQVDGAS